MPLSLASVPASARQDSSPPPASSTPAATPKARESAPGTAAGKALAQAKKDKRRVEIESLRSESATFYANPDGKTIRMELHSKPIRVKISGDNNFTPIDTTLVEADGVIRPKAAKGNLVLSAGRDKTLLKSRAAGETATITTPSALPEPRLKGDTATYPGAYGKGRDLVVTANPAGFQQRITIAERPDGPVSFRVPVDLPKGLSFKKDAAGRPVIVGKDGKTLTEVRPTPVRDARAADAAAPIDAGKVGKAAVTLAGDGRTLVFTPDAAFLADPAVTFPVTLTAAVSDWWEGHTGQWQLGGMDTFVNNADYPDSWDNFSLDRILVGKSNSGSVRWRGYLRFPDIPDEFAGSTVQNADLILWNYYSNACGLSVGSGITARRVTSSWDELTLHWNSQPTVTSAGADSEYGAYSDTGCSGSMAHAWDLVHSLDDIVQAWVDGQPNYGIQLTAGNESDQTNWRRYRTDEAGGCKSAPLQDCQGRLHPPILTVDFLPRKLKLAYFSEVGPRRTTHPSLAEFAAKGEVLEEGETPETGDLTDEELQAMMEEQSVPAEVGPDDLLHQPDDDQWLEPEGQDQTPPTVTGTSPADGATLVPRDTTVRAVFSEPVWDAEVSVTDGAGTAVTGTVSLPDGSAEPVFTPAAPLAEGATYTVEITDAYDDEGNAMAPYSWSFTTSPPAAGHWKLDEGQGATAADSSGRGRDATLTGTAGWVPGKIGEALSNEPAQARLTASREAVRRSSPVEVPEETTESSVTYALPDGRTYRTDIAAGPVRTRQAGKWVPIDSTLVAADGVLRPRAGVAGVEFSLGGKGVFAKLVRPDGTEFALEWPGVLPRPQVKGDVATYVDAAGPGADLVVTALSTGFRHDVVLRRRPASAVEYRLPVRTDGLTLSEGGDGGLRLVTPKGKTAASAPKPVMWDTGTAGKPGRRKGEIVTELVAENGRQVLVLRPDAAFLADPATKYPVIVDPTTTLPTLSDVWISDYGVTGALTQSDDTLWVGTYTEDGVPGVERAYLKFDTTAITGANVSAATLSLNRVGAIGCGDSSSGIRAQRVTAGWTPGAITWSNKPATTSAGEQTLSDFTTCGATGTASWNASAFAQAWATGSPNYGIMLRGVDETVVGRPYYDRGFESNEGATKPSLSVTYTLGSAPAVADPVVLPAATVSGTTTATSLTPQLAATVSDTVNGSLTAEFEVEHDPADTTGGTGSIWAGSVTAVTSGSVAALTVPPGTLLAGQLVRWRVRAVNPGQSTSSVWSSWRTMRINPAAAPAPVSSPLAHWKLDETTGTTAADATGGPYPATLGGTAAWSGGLFGGAMTGGGASTSGPVPRTDQSFTISAWLRLADDTGAYEMARQMGNVKPAFSLGTNPSTRQLEFLVHTGDSSTATANGVRAGTVPVKRWFHVTGVYDRTAGRVTLYRDGQSIGTSTVPATWNAAGPLTFGRVLNGALDDVRVYQKALSATEVAAITAGSPAPDRTPVISQLQTDPGTPVTTTTPTLKARVSEPGGQALRAEFQVERDPAEGGGSLWTTGKDNVASGADATVTVPTGVLSDGWSVRWRARAVRGATSSPWSSWQTFTVDVPKPAIAGLQAVPSAVVGGVTVTTTLTPALRGTVSEPGAGQVRAEFQIEHDPGQGTGPIWAGTSSDVASGQMAQVTVPTGALTDGQQVRWRARAVAAGTSATSGWSAWRTLTVDVPGDGTAPVIDLLQVAPSAVNGGTVVTDSPAPALIGRAFSPDGGAARAEFEVEHHPDAPAGQGTGQIWTGAADDVASGGQASVTVPAGTLKDGHLVRWRARLVAAPGTSPWSPWRDLSVELADPVIAQLRVDPSETVGAKTVTTSLTPALKAQVSDPYGAGTHAEFELEHDPGAPAGQGSGLIWSGGSADVASGSDVSAAVPGGELSDGWQVRWRARAVTPSATSAWSPWQDLTVDIVQPGEEPLAATSQAVVDTGRSYSVAAWLRWDDKDGAYTVAEQRGTHQAPFRLGNDPDAGLVFTLTSADSASATVAGVLSGVEPPVGEWFHLAGVYDAGTGTATLYKDGTVIGSQVIGFPAWNAAAPMTLGTSMRGGIDDVRVYQAALKAAEVDGLYDAAAAPAFVAASGISVARPASAAPASRAAGPVTTAAATTFPYGRKTLQQCEDMREAADDGVLQFEDYWRPYTFCASRHHYFSWFIPTVDDGDIDGIEVRTLTFSATVVAHSYLGTWKPENSTVPSGVTPDGGGVNRHPNDLAVWVRIDDVDCYDDNGGCDEIMSLKVFHHPLRLGGQCQIIHGTSEAEDRHGERIFQVQNRIGRWEDLGDDGHYEHFVYRSFNTDSNSYHHLSKCHIRPWIEVEALDMDPTDPGRKVFSVALWDRPKHANGLRYDNGPSVRCDLSPSYVAYYGACVFSRVSRVYQMRRTDPAGAAKPMSQVARHIEDTWRTPLNTFPKYDFQRPRQPITQKLFPGSWVPGAGRSTAALHFLSPTVRTDDGKSTIRRRNKGMKDKVCTKDFTAAELVGKECDEYPFYSTWEGAAQGYKGTFAGKNPTWNFSIRPVDVTHNKNAGTDLQLFYAQYRFFNNDPYWISMN
ncbi:hypothetical protein GCM10009677_63590 [Sphaerisporangium rubeum]|nr:DNRLRE domain-containing protein [Sphaerisporangium rubeum]